MEEEAATNRHTYAVVKMLTVVHDNKGVPVRLRVKLIQKRFTK